MKVDGETITVPCTDDKIDNFQLRKCVGDAFGIPPMKFVLVDKQANTPLHYDEDVVVTNYKKKSSPLELRMELRKESRMASNGLWHINCMKDAA